MLNLVQSQKQTLKISPGQIQLLNFLQLNTQELEQHLKNELEENPVLEEGVDEAKDEFDSAETSGNAEDNTQDYMDWDEFRDDDLPDYRTRIQNHSEDDNAYTPIVAETVGWREELKEQFHLLLPNERQQQLADFLIDSLTDEGYLLGSPESLADDVSFTNGMYVEESEIQDLVKRLHQMDPAGLGARNLQECLLLQLQRRSQAEAAKKLVKEHFEELATHNYEKLRRESGLSPDELKEAIALITSLNPHPVGPSSNALIVKDNVVPDYIVTVEGELIDVALNSWGIPPLRINNTYAQEVGGSRAANTYVSAKVTAANWLIDAIQQRETTMLKTIRTLVNLQRTYFLTGDIRQLKPMVLRDIAERINMDISTISRVTSGKYVQTPFGVIHLKDLFTEGIMTDNGTEVSNRQIQSALFELVANENKHEPLNDFQLTELLAQRGYNVARRTVAKYREVLAISPAPLRRIL